MEKEATNGFTEVGGKVVEGVEYVDPNHYIPMCEKILKHVGNLRLVGETGVGKTTLVHKLAEKMKVPLFEVVLTRDISRWDLLATDVLEKGETKTREGIILLWLQAEKGILYLDGFNYAEPSIISLVESLADFRGTIWISEKQRTYRRSGKHHLVISFNPTEKSGYCLRGNSLISVPKNYNYSPIKFINEGTTILNMQNKPQRVSNSMIRNNIGAILEIKARGILPICCSKSHKIMTVHRRFHAKYNPEKYAEGLPKYSDDEWLYSSPIMKKAESLMVYQSRYPFASDCLVFPKLKIEKDCGFSDEMVGLFGLFVAEGSTPDNPKGNYKVYWCLGSHETELVNETTEFLKHEGFNPYTVKQGNGVRVGINSKKMWKFVREHFGTKSTSKRIPKFIMESTRHQTDVFLKKYIRGDGHKDRTYVSFKTVSQKLALQLQKLYSKLDVFVRLSSPKSLQAKTVRINDRTFKTHKKYRGMFSMFFAQRTGYKFPEPKRKPFATIGETEDYFYLPIRTIKKLPNKHALHDITTEDSTLQVNNVIVSNSGTFIQNIATMRRFEGLVIDYLPIREETRLIMKLCDDDYDWSRKWVEFAKKTRDLYRNGNIRTPLTTGNLINYARLHKAGMADDEIMEIVKSLYAELERETVARQFEEAEELTLPDEEAEEAEAENEESGESEK